MRNRRWLRLRGVAGWRGGELRTNSDGQDVSYVEVPRYPARLPSLFRIDSVQSQRSSPTFESSHHHVISRPRSGRRCAAHSAQTHHKGAASQTSPLRIKAYSSSGSQLRVVGIQSPPSMRRFETIAT